MITEFNVVDHAGLDEKTKTMILLIVDYSEIWQSGANESVTGFRTHRHQRELNLKHLLCLKKKVECYIDYIQKGGISKSFPYCSNPSEYSYDIRIVTDFDPKSDYLRVIDNLNAHISKYYTNVFVSTERIQEQ